VDRFKHQYPLAPGNKNTFYEGGATGLIDFPFMTTLQ
jgi:N-ethylmaleimide reductase